MEKNYPTLVELKFQELLSKKKKLFPRTRQSFDAPETNGVYIIYSPDDKVLHVGASLRGKKGIKQRLKNHLRGASSFSKKYLQIEKINTNNYQLSEGCTFRAIEVKDDPKLRAYLEQYAVGKLCPEHIGTGASKSL